MPDSPHVRLSPDARIVCYTMPGSLRQFDAVVVARRGSRQYDLTYYVCDVQMPIYGAEPGPRGKPHCFCEQDPPARTRAAREIEVGGCTWGPDAGPAAGDIAPGETPADAAHAAVDIGD